MTTADVAAALGIKDSRVRQLVLANRLAPLRRVRGAFLFSVEEVERFKAQPRRLGRPSKPDDAPVAAKRPRGRPRKAAPADAPAADQQP